MGGANGYRHEAVGGPRVRTDIVDVYVFRRGGGGERDEGYVRSGREEVQFLQLRRTGEPLDGTWQPVMGHVERGETAVRCALRELEEEVGLAWGSEDLLGVWALEQVHPYYLAALDSIVMSPRFAAEVPRGWQPHLNGEHSGVRWVHEWHVTSRFMWPGQVEACREITGVLLRPGSLSAEGLRVREVV